MKTRHGADRQQRRVGQVQTYNKEVYRWGGCVIRKRSVQTGRQTSKQTDGQEKQQQQINENVMHTDTR